MKKIVVFCGSSLGFNPIYKEAAITLGNYFVANDITLVYGGGKIGMMGVLSETIFPAIELILSKFPSALISVDTFRSKIARKSVEVGACMINDISAGEMDSNMFATIRELQVPYCIMHMKGTPQNMQKKPSYKNVTEEVLFFLAQKIELLHKLGVNDILVDPGFGFGKTTEHNYELLKNLSFFKNLNKAILVGVSRKSMIYKTLGISPQESLNGTTALHSFSLQNGGTLLRVHDVKEAMETITLFNKIS